MVAADPFAFAFAFAVLSATQEVVWFKIYASAFLLRGKSRYVKCCGSKK